MDIQERMESSRQIRELIKSLEYQINRYNLINEELKKSVIRLTPKKQRTSQNSGKKVRIVYRGKHSKYSDLANSRLPKWSY